MKFSSCRQKFLPLSPPLPLVVTPFFLLLFSSSPLLYLLPMPSPPLSLLSLYLIYPLNPTCVHAPMRGRQCSSSLLQFSLSHSLLCTCMCIGKGEEDIPSYPPLPSLFPSLTFLPLSSSLCCCPLPSLYLYWARAKKTLFARISFVSLSHACVYVNDTNVLPLISLHLSHLLLFQPSFLHPLLFSFSLLTPLFFVTWQKRIPSRMKSLCVVFSTASLTSTLLRVSGQKKFLLFAPIRLPSPFLLLPYLFLAPVFLTIKR